MAETSQACGRVRGWASRAHGWQRVSARVGARTDVGAGQGHGIADIFEALTAKDRPYKKGKTLNESLQILGKFKEGGHIDPDLFDVFVREKVYPDYAKQFLAPEQIDEWI